MKERNSSISCKLPFCCVLHATLAINLALAVAGEAREAVEGEPGRSSQKTLSAGAADSASKRDKIDTLKAQIEQSMQAFTKTSMPDAEKMKLFDKSLADLDMLLDQTEEGGPLDSLCEASISENSARLKILNQEQASSSAEVDRVALEAAILSGKKKRQLVAATHAELLAKKEHVLEEQLAFLAAEQTTRKSIDSVMQSMSELNEVIDRLGGGLAAGVREE